MDSTTDKILNVKECAKMLHISISMLRKLLYEGEINSFKIGNRYYFRESDNESFVDNKIRRYV